MRWPPRFASSATRGTGARKKQKRHGAHRQQREHEISRLVPDRIDQETRKRGPQQCSHCDAETERRVVARALVPFAEGADQVLRGNRVKNIQGADQRRRYEGAVNPAR